MRAFIVLLLCLPVLVVSAIDFDAQGTLPDSLVHPETLRRAHCLGISYDTPQNQAMIGYDVPLSARVNPFPLAAEPYYGFKFTDMMSDREIEWWFLNGMWVSPLEVYSQDWPSRDSRYFRYVVEDETLLSEHGMAAMDAFVDEAGEKLGLTDADLDLLAREKILYYLCSDCDSVFRLTGYHTRGVFMLGPGAIVSHLPCHFHEAAHLLVNFRLRDVPLFTHPFFQEGLATWLGGRAGKSSEVIVQLGAFLLESGMMSEDDVLDGARFSQSDASFAYPVAAAMHQQCMRHGSMDDYLARYLAHSSPDPAVRATVVADFPWMGRAAPRWPQTIRLPLNPQSTPLAGSENFAISPGDDGWVRVACKPGWLLFTSNEASPVRSALLEELLPGRAYAGEAYALRVSADEIALYDLHTATMTAAYITAFTTEMQPVPQVGEMLVFEVRAEAWPGDAAKIVWAE